MKTLLCLALSGAATAASAQTPAAASTASTVVVRTASSSPVTTGAQETFTGSVRISSPFQAQSPGTAGGATVSFEARARTAWHTHPLGQALVVTAGLGLVQQAGQPAQAIRPGDVVSIPANVRHWHGAGPDGSMSHVAIAERADGISVTWQDKVSDQDYETAVTSAGLASTSAAVTVGHAAQSTGEPRATASAQPASEILSAKQRAIPLIASLLVASDMPKLNAALNQGLDAGMTVSEAKEILVQLYAYAGFPKSLNALGELMQVVETRKQRGIQDAPGRGPSRPIATGNELVAAGKANQTKISGGPVQGPLFDFAPVINQFLQAHLFGDIYFDNVQFDRRPETLDQFFRSVTPNTGPYDSAVISDAMAALFAKTGPAILFTHSQGGGPGWLTAIKNPNVRAIVAFEPGSGFIFPQGEVPPAMPSAAGTLSPEAVPPSDFQKLTRVPITVYYGDNFPVEPTTERGQDNWRVRLAMARLWVDAINKHGGDARLVHLPEIGIRGNTHFLMSDLNNVQIADLVSKFLAEKKLD